MRRYNFLYNHVNPNAISLNTLISAILAGILATLVYALTYGTPDDKGMLVVTIEGLMGVSSNESFLHTSLGNQLFIVMLLIFFFVTCLIIIVAAVMIPSLIISRSFKDNKLDYDLYKFEMKLIEKILTGVHGSSIPKKIFLAVKQKEQGVESKMIEKSKIQFWKTIHVKFVLLLVFISLASLIISIFFANIAIAKITIAIAIVIVCLVYIASLAYAIWKQKGELFNVMSSPEEIDKASEAAPDDKEGSTADVLEEYPEHTPSLDQNTPRVKEEVTSR